MESVIAIILNNCGCICDLKMHCSVMKRDQFNMELVAWVHFKSDPVYECNLDTYILNG